MTSWFLLLYICENHRVLARILCSNSNATSWSVSAAFCNSRGKLPKLQNFRRIFFSPIHRAVIKIQLFLRGKNFDKISFRLEIRIYIIPMFIFIVQNIRELLYQNSPRFSSSQHVSLLCFNHSKIVSLKRKLYPTWNFYKFWVYIVNKLEFKIESSTNQNLFSSIRPTKLLVKEIHFIPLVTSLLGSSRSQSWYGKRFSPLW